MGEKMQYKFICNKCRIEYDISILIKDYDRLKNEQFCEKCKNKLERVIEWSGIAEGSGQGWYGARGGNVI